MSCFLWNGLPAVFYEDTFFRLSKEETKKVADNKKQGMFMQLEQRNKIRKSFVYVMCGGKIV